MSPERDNTTTATTTTITTNNNNNGNGSLERLTCTYPQRFTFFKCTCFQNHMFSKLHVFKIKRIQHVAVSFTRNARSKLGQLFVRRTHFGQFDELYSFLN